MPKVSSADAVEALLARCAAYELRLDSEKGVRRRTGKNQNILAAYHLRLALDALRDLDIDCTIRRVIEHEHAGAG